MNEFVRHFETAEITDTAGPAPSRSLLFRLLPSRRLPCRRPFVVGGFLYGQTSAVENNDGLPAAFSHVVHPSLVSRELLIKGL